MTTPPSNRLADHTTFHLGGPAARFEVAEDEHDLVRLVDEADRAGTPVLLLGGGSNMLVGDDGFDGLVIAIATRGIQPGEVSTCAGANVTVAAGEDWDAFVAHSIEQEWTGLAPLSGIPGQVGATPIQNVGAYGAEVGSHIARVRTWDRQARTQRTFANIDCGFGYRWSRFKADPGRYVVLDVSFQFLLGDRLQHVRYAQLAGALGVEVGDQADSAQVRETVLGLRRSKGMVIDPADHDTWSAGSFFTNPILDADQAAALPAGAPRYPVAANPAAPSATGTDPSTAQVKTSAAWLIDHAGFPKGWHLPQYADGQAPASLSTKHTLALTNRGTATTADVVDLARAIVAGVRQAYGITLVPEPNLIACSLEEPT